MIGTENFVGSELDMNFREHVFQTPALRQVSIWTKDDKWVLT